MRLVNQPISDKIEEVSTEIVETNAIDSSIDIISDAASGIPAPYKKKCI
ncbi:MAG: hypothetical protein ACI854_001399 [Arenicella sp.]|jgi:hypothetical protein